MYSQISSHKVPSLQLPDGIIIKSASDLLRAAQLRNSPGGHLRPVIDLTGDYRSECDAVGHQALQETVDAFAARRSKLANWVLASERPDVRLLAYLYLTGVPLTARYTPDNKAAIGYGRLAPVPLPNQTAEELVSAGYLARRLFDRVHYCDRCSSARLNVREECPSCRGVDLRTETLLHHFKCVYQGPEPDFRADDSRLVCPKCARELRHYGTEYERSGTVQQCGTCGQTSTEPAIGFVCMDCSAHFDSENVRAREYFHYELTEAGTTYLLQPHPRSGDHVLRHLYPLAIATRIAALAAQGGHFVVCEISYKRERALVHEHGADAFERARRQFIDELRAQMVVDCLIAESRDHDYALVPAVTKSELLPSLNERITHVMRTLRHDLGVKAFALDCNEILTCST